MKSFIPFKQGGIGFVGFKSFDEEKFGSEVCELESKIFFELEREEESYLSLFEFNGWEFISVSFGWLQRDEVMEYSRMLILFFVLFLFLFFECEHLKLMKMIKTKIHENLKTKTKITLKINEKLK